MALSASFAMWFLKCSSLYSPFSQRIGCLGTCQKSPITVMFMCYSTDKHVLKDAVSIAN